MMNKQQINDNKKYVKIDFDIVHTPLKQHIFNLHVTGKPITDIKSELAKILDKSFSTVETYHRLNKTLGEFTIQEYFKLVDYFKLH